MTILVTGGAGYIGSHMVHALRDAGERAVVLDNLSTGFEWAVPDGVELIVGETGDAAKVSALIAEHGVTAIIHFAASIVVPESVVKPLMYYRNNTANSRILIECAINGGVKHFIFSSTAAVYGNPSKVPIAEDDALAPMSPYGSSKLMTETMLRDAAAAHGLGNVVLRYFNVAGADPQLRTGQSSTLSTHLIKIACETALGKRKEMQVFGTDYPTPDGTCIRDYIHVTDLAAAHLAALAHLRRGGANATFNCGYGHGYSVLEVIDSVKRVCGHDVAMKLAERRAGDPASLVADSRRIRDALGWTPRFNDLDTIVRHALAWEARLAELRRA